MTSVITHYRLDADPTSDRLEFLLCDLFRRDVALRRVLPALRETGHFTSELPDTDAGVTMNCTVRHDAHRFQFSIETRVDATDNATNAIQPIEHLMLRAGALGVDIPVMHATPIYANARRYGTPRTTRAVDAEQLRIEIPDHAWNRVLLPLFVRLLTGTQDGRVPVIAQTLRCDIPWSVEQTVDSLTGTHHVYLTARAPLYDWASATLYPALLDYFADANVYHTAHPQDDGAWVESHDRPVSH